MAVFLLVIGSVLLISAYEGKEQQLFALIKQDFSGQDSFLKWGAAIIFIGALGYVPQLKSISRAFLVLVIVVLLVKSNTGFFSRLQQHL